MLRNTIVRSLLVASLAMLAASASAQYATPTPSQAQPPTGATQNGSMDSQSNTQYNTILPTAPQQGTDDQMKAYLDARRACDGQPLAQQAACNDNANTQFGAVDSKCQKMSGAALADCLQGADHGG
jgi:hypothetical protein